MIPPLSSRNLAVMVAAAAVVACGSDAVAPSGAPVSAAHSVVLVSQPTVLAGAAVVLTLEARDAFNDPVTKGGLAVAFGLSGGTSQGTIGDMVDHDDGSYSAVLTGVTAGTPATVGATIDGVPVTSPLPTVQVMPGPVSPVVSSLSVAPATIVVGGTATIELVTRDAHGNPIGTGGRAVAFSVGGGTSAGAIGPTTDHQDGHYTATFTASARGTPLVVNATVDGIPVNTPLPILTVAFGVSADSSVIEISSDTVSIGNAVLVTLRVVDSAGVARTSGGEDVVFSLAAGPGEGTIDSTNDHDDGSYTANFTGTRAGAVLIGVTLAGQPVGPAPALTILSHPPSPQHSSVTVSDDTVAAGSSATLTLIVRDVDSTQVTGGGLAVEFTASDGLSSGVIGPVTDHGDGSYTALFTGRVAGSGTMIGATINDSSRVQMLDTLSVSHLPTITVIPGPHSVDSSLFAVFPTTLTLGDSARLLLTVRDGFGNPVEQGGVAATFQRLGGPGVGVGIIRPATDHGDGTYSAYYVADSAGMPDTLTARLNGALLPAFRPTISVSCVAGPVSLTVSELTINDTTTAQTPKKAVTLPSGVSTTITVRVRDAVGCPIIAPHLVAVTTTGGTSTGILGPVAGQGDGSYTAVLAGVIAGTATTVQATIDGSLMLGLPVTATVIPGDISPTTSSVTVLPSAIDSGAHAVATLQARDAAGNLLVTGGRLVALLLSPGASHGTLGATADLGNGRYAAVYSGTAAEPGAPDLVSAIIEATPVVTLPAGIEVVAGTIAPEQSLVSAPAATVVVGDSLLVTLAGKDASGRSLVTGDRAVPIVFTLSGGTSTGVFGPVHNLGNGSYTAWLTATGSGTATTIGATIDGNPVTTALPVVSVNP